MTVVEMELPAFTDEVLDLIVEFDTTGFWLTEIINGERYVDRLATAPEIAAWKLRDAARKEAAEIARAKAAQDAYDGQLCGSCGIARTAEVHWPVEEGSTEQRHEFDEEPWIPPIPVEDVTSKVDEFAPVEHPDGKIEFKLG